MAKMDQGRRYRSIEATRPILESFARGQKCRGKDLPSSSWTPTEGGREPLVSDDLDVLLD